MKKAVVVGMYFLVVAVAAVLMPVPRAQACWKDCVLIQCADGGSGYQTVTDFGNDAYTLTRNPFICRTSCCTEAQVYAECAEFLCSMSAAAEGMPGKLYVVGSSNTDVVELTIPESKFEEISDAIEHSNLQRDTAIASVASRFSVPLKHLTPEQFKNRHGQKAS